MAGLDGDVGVKSAVAVPDIQVSVPVGTAEITALKVRLENSPG